MTIQSAFEKVEQGNATPPRNRLGMDPDIESVEDLEHALAELSYIKSQRSHRQAILDQQVKLLAIAAKKKC